MVSAQTHRARGEAVPGVGNEQAGPLPLRAERLAGVDGTAPTVTRAGVEVGDGANLGLREAGVAIDAARTPVRREVTVGIETAPEGVVDHAVGDAVVPIARGEHRVGQDLQLANAVEAPVAVGVERQGAGEPVAEHPLQQPDPHRVHLLVVVGGRPRHDTVEVARVALRLHQPLPAAGRAAFEVGILGRRAVVGPDQRLRRHRRQVDRAVAEIDLRLPIVVGERRPRLGAVVMTGVAVGHGVPGRHPMIREVEVAVLPAVAPLDEPPVPAARQRKLHVKMNRRGKNPLDVAVGAAVGLGQTGVGDREVAHMQERLAAAALGVGRRGRLLGAPRRRRGVVKPQGGRRRQQDDDHASHGNRAPSSIAEP